MDVLYIGAFRKRKQTRKYFKIFSYMVPSFKYVIVLVCEVEITEVKKDHRNWMGKRF